MDAMRKPRTDEPFQMAPMIDMVFLLLVFFMTVSTLAKDARPEIPLPVSTTAVVPEEIQPRDVITVRMTGDDLEVFWHNRTVSIDELAKRLNGMAGKEREPALLLRGPPQLPWSAWEKIVGLCRDAGVGDIQFATHES